MNPKDMACESGRDAMYVLEYIVLMQERMLRNDEPEPENAFLDGRSSLEEIRSLLAEKNRNEGIRETESTRPTGSSSTCTDNTSEDDLSFLDANSSSTLDEDSSESESELPQVNDYQADASFLRYERMTKRSHIDDEVSDIEDNVKQPVNPNIFYTVDENFWNGPELMSLTDEESATGHTVPMERLEMLEEIEEVEEEELLKSNEVDMEELGAQQNLEMFEESSCWTENFSYDECEDQERDLVDFEDVPKPQNCVISAFFMQVDTRIPKCDENNFVPSDDVVQENRLTLSKTQNTDKNQGQMNQNNMGKYEDSSETIVDVSATDGEEDMSSTMAEAKVTVPNDDSQTAAVEKQLEEIISFYRDLQKSLLTLLHRKTRMQVDLFDCKIRFGQLRSLQNENLPTDKTRRAFIKVCKRIDSLEDKLDEADIQKFDLKCKMAQCRRDAKELQKQCTQPLAKKIRKVLSAM